MGLAMYDQTSRVNLIDGAREFGGHALIVEINRQSVADMLRLKPLAETYRRGRLIEAVEEPFWKEIRKYYAKAGKLFGMTHEWLEAL